eukprot:RCo041282
MGGSQSKKQDNVLETAPLPQGVALKPSENAGDGPQEEAQQLSVVDTQALMTPDLAALASDEALEMAMGLLMERLYCPTQAHLLFKCLQQSGVSSPEEAVKEGGQCYPENMLLAECAGTKEVAMKCSRFVEHFAHVKCKPEGDALTKCLRDHKASGRHREECSALAMATFGCGARHVLALFSTVPEDK